MVFVLQYTRDFNRATRGLYILNIANLLFTIICIICSWISIYVSLYLLNHFIIFTLYFNKVIVWAVNYFTLLNVYFDIIKYVYNSWNWKMNSMTTTLKVENLFDVCFLHLCPLTLCDLYSFVYIFLFMEFYVFLINFKLYWIWLINVISQSLYSLCFIKLHILEKNCFKRSIFNIFNACFIN